jgi:hypothetical protein
MRCRRFFGFEDDGIAAVFDEEPRVKPMFADELSGKADPARIPDAGKRNLVGFT